MRHQLAQHCLSALMVSALALTPVATLAQAAPPEAAAVRPAAAARAAPAQPTMPSLFLTLSDIHYSGANNGSPGTPNCAKPETSPTLWGAAQAQLQRLNRRHRPTFVIYLGDLPSHCWNRPLTDLSTPLDGLAQVIGTAPKLFYVPGNNDSIAGDYHAFTTGGKTPLSLSPQWKASPVLNPGASDLIDMSHVDMGYYAAYAVAPAQGAVGLRVIVLNTNMFTANYGINEYGTVKADTNAQIEWLETQLADVRSHGEKAIIAMHVPPGTDGSVVQSADIKTMWDGGLNYTGTVSGLRHGWVQGTFLDIVARYQAEIVGTLSSHTHYNEIRRLRDCTQNLPNLGAFTELDLAIPSITTDHGNNPSMKLIAFDSQYEFVENTTFYANDKLGKSWTRTGTANAPLSFDNDNYRCQNCAPGDSLHDRIATLDTATKIDSSPGLTGQMTQWIRPGAAPPSAPHQYSLALDATCEVPTAGNIK